MAAITTFLVGVLAAGGSTLLAAAVERLRRQLGLSPDTPLARLWAWGRALRLLDGPDEVHLRSIARHELRRQRETTGATLAAHLRRWRDPRST